MHPHPSTNLPTSQTGNAEPTVDISRLIQKSVNAHAAEDWWGPLENKEMRGPYSRSMLRSTAGNPHLISQRTDSADLSTSPGRP